MKTKDMAERRKYERMAPAGVTLALKPLGLFSIFHPNLALDWIDVSEGGIGVLATRKLKIGELLRAYLTDRYYRDAFNVKVEVRHVRPSHSRPDCYVAGLKFIQPSPVMRMCIRSLVDTGSMPQRNLVAALRRVG